MLPLTVVFALVWLLTFRVARALIAEERADAVKARDEWAALSIELRERERTIRLWESEYGPVIGMLRAQRELEARFGEAYRRGICTCREETLELLDGVTMREGRVIRLPVPERVDERPVCRPVVTEPAEFEYFNATCANCGGIIR